MGFRVTNTMSSGGLGVFSADQGFVVLKPGESTTVHFVDPGMHMLAKKGALAILAEPEREQPRPNRPLLIRYIMGWPGRPVS